MKTVVVVMNAIVKKARIVLVVMTAIVVNIALVAMIANVELLVDVIDKKGDIVEQGRRIEVPGFMDLWSAVKYNKYVLNLTASSAYTNSDVLKRFDI